MHSQQDKHMWHGVGGVLEKWGVLPRGKKGKYHSIPLNFPSSVLNTERLPSEAAASSGLYRPFNARDEVYEKNQKGSSFSKARI